MTQEQLTRTTCFACDKQETVGGAYTRPPGWATVDPPGGSPHRYLCPSCWGDLAASPLLANINATKQEKLRKLRGVR